jgi:hypothetical protein
VSRLIATAVGGDAARFAALDRALTYARAAGDVVHLVHAYEALAPDRLGRPTMLEANEQKGAAATQVRDVEENYAAATSRPGCRRCLEFGRSGWGMSSCIAIAVGLR